VGTGFPQTEKQVPLRNVNQTTIRELEKAVPESMKKADIPGVSLALIKDGNTYWVHSFGVKNTTTQQPVTNGTVFEAASLSKPVLAYAVLKLVDEGKINLDTPLTKYLPGSYDVSGDDRINQITARIVLSHRTGFPNWRDDGPLKIFFQPGERFSYSGEGFVYLGKVVEHITGMPLNDFIKKTVFDPLGMTSSSYLWRPDYDHRAATGHNGDGKPQEKNKPTKVNAAASLHTTASDYARFMEAILNGTGLKPATRKAMLTAQVAVDPECTNCTDREPKSRSKEVFWGLGVGLQKTPQGESFWHWGDNGVFKCYMVAYVKQKTGLVMFTNSENGLAIREDVVETALGGEQPAFEWARYDTYNSPAFRFWAAIKDKGTEAAIPEFRAPLKSGEISEESLNTIGYRLVRRKNFSDAIRIFRLNVENHPGSWNAYDSLGEGYMDAGEKALAIQNYEKSLKLNPKNSNGEAMLKKLMTGTGQ
ncbi:MAG TPA: serine hydrolase, partial [Terriglobales bacterium]|nr:serine hydrolase [Terriglobales bacterium]